MNRIIKFFQAIFIVLFFIVLLYVYAYMQEGVGYRFDNSGRSISSVSRETFFYTALAIFAFSNLLCLALVSALKKIPVQNQGDNPLVFSNLSFRESLLDWIRSFNVVLNFSYVCILIFLGMLNNSEYLSDLNYEILLFAGPLFIVIWFIILFTIIIKRK